MIRTLLLLSLSVMLRAQVGADHFSMVKEVVGLTDFQVAQCQVPKPQAAATTGFANSSIGLYRPPDHAVRDQPERDAKEKGERILADWQRGKLAEIAKAANSFELASVSISLGLITAKQWNGVTLCYYPLRAYASELSLTDFQIQQFEKMANGERTRAAAMTLLSVSQQEKNATFAKALQVATEAEEVGLIYRLKGGEPLCN